MRHYRLLLCVLPVVVSAFGCELVSGLSELEKDENFDPDAELPVPVQEGGPGADADGAALDETGTDTGGGTVETAPPMDTGPACTEAEGKVFEGHCYFPIKMNMSWDAAKAACAAQGAYLVVITSSAENAHVATIHPTAERWIGLSGMGMNKADYAWHNGESVAFDGWGEGEPNEAGAACARMREGLWYDRVCTETVAPAAEIHAICERN